MFRKALKIKQIQGAPTRSQASTINNIGIALQNKGCFDEAIQQFEKALEMYVSPGGYSNPDVGDGAIQRSNTLHTIAECYRALNDMDKACSYFEQSYKLRKKELKIVHRSTQHSAIQLASALFQTNKFEKSLEIFEEVLEGQKQTYPEDSSVLAQTYNNIGTVLSELKQYERALPNIQEAIRIFEKRLDKSDPNLSKAYDNLNNIKSKMAQ